MSEHLSSPWAVSPLEPRLWDHSPFSGHGDRAGGQSGWISGFCEDEPVEAEVSSWGLRHGLKNELSESPFPFSIAQTLLTDLFRCLLFAQGSGVREEKKLKRL